MRNVESTKPSWNNAKPTEWGAQIWKRLWAKAALPLCCCLGHSFFLMKPLHGLFLVNLVQCSALPSQGGLVAISYGTLMLITENIGSFVTASFQKWHTNACHCVLTCAVSCWPIIAVVFFRLVEICPFVFIPAVGRGQLRRQVLWMVLFYFSNKGFFSLKDIQSKLGMVWTTQAARWNIVAMFKWL